VPAEGGGTPPGILAESTSRKRGLMRHPHLLASETSASTDWVQVAELVSWSRNRGNRTLRGGYVRTASPPGGLVPVAEARVELAWPAYEAGLCPALPARYVRKSK
jgi:hypothetical protein